MKTKDLILLAVAIIILVGSGLVIFNQLTPSTAKAAKAKGEAVEIAPVVADSFDQAALGEVTDAERNRSFAVPLDTSTGVGNDAPFGR